jgi:hypothetical protein
MWEMSWQAIVILVSLGIAFVVIGRFAVHIPDEHKSGGLRTEILAKYHQEVAIMHIVFLIERTS